MKLGRIILAGLAPLFSLSAVAAGWMTGTTTATSTGQVALAQSLPRLLSAVPYVLAGVEQSPVRTPSEGRGAHSVLLSLDALAFTPFEGSLWLLASLFSINLLYRTHAFAPLRC